MRAGGLALGLTLLLLTGAACSGSDKRADGAGTQQQGNDVTIAQMLPDTIRQKGSIDVATGGGYPPAGFVGPDGTLQGWDIDLGKALGDVLGVEFRMQRTVFQDLVPGLENGRYTLGMASIIITKERAQVLDFVSYFRNRSGLMVVSASTFRPAALDDLCGHKAAVLQGSAQAQDLEAQKAKCASSGKPALEVQTYPHTADANLALSSGRADVTAADAQNLNYLAGQQAGKFEVVATYGEAMAGIAISRRVDSQQLAKAVQAALTKLIKDGTYQTILKKWNVEFGVIDTPEINPAVQR